MFEEIDYILEGQNAERFASLYSYKPRKLFFFVQHVMVHYGNEL